MAYLLGLYDECSSTNDSIDEKSWYGAMVIDDQSKIKKTREFEQTSRISEEFGITGHYHGYKNGLM